MIKYHSFANCLNVAELQCGLLSLRIKFDLLKWNKSVVTICHGFTGI